MKLVPVMLVAVVAMGIGVQRSPTFANDIAPIIYANCASCHRPGQAGPFPLLAYDDVRKHADEIVDVTRAREMPPWHAARAPGFPEYRDERRLTDGEIATISRWVEAGMPTGDVRSAPMPPVFPNIWSLGLPDLLLTLPRPIDVPASGPDVFRNVTVRLDLPDDRWITAIDYQPSARSVVHHTLFFAGPSDTVVRDDDPLPGLGRAFDTAAGVTPAARFGGADSSWIGLGGWAPGVTARFFPDGIAQPLPRFSNLVIQFHLHPSGTAAQEDGRIAIYFARTAPKKTLTGVQVPPLFGFAAGIDIPAGDARYVVRDSFELPVDVEAYGARGHAHYLCREMKMTATLPNRSTRGLLWINRWDFAWQDSYFFKTPIRLPKGTRIDVEMTYDNSAGNPKNPNSPPARVRWGRESTDEMGSMTVLVATPAPADALQLRNAQTQHFRQQLLKNAIRR